MNNNLAEIAEICWANYNSTKFYSFPIVSILYAQSLHKP